MTVFLTTHYMDETTDVDHVRILDNGKIAAEGTPIELKNRYTDGLDRSCRIYKEALSCRKNRDRNLNAR